MLGFINGLAIVIFLAQFEQFKVAAPDGGQEWISGLPEFAIPAVPLTLETLRIIFPYALIFTAISLIESLLTFNLVGEKTGTRGGASQECRAQGAANVVTGFFGGMGGCAMIGQSMINCGIGRPHAVIRRYGGTAAAELHPVAPALIEQIPLAALVGVMFMVVIGTFAWKSVSIIARVPRTDATVIVLVTIITVLTDLAIAVVAGVIIPALAYAWSNATRIRANVEDDDGTRIYRVEGPLFFGSAAGFLELFDARNDPDHVIFDFTNSRVADQSALQAIETLAARYRAQGTRLELRHLSRDCHTLLTKAGQLMVDSDDGPDYGVAVHYGVRIGRFGGAH